MAGWVGEPPGRFDTQVPLSGTTVPESGTVPPLAFGGCYRHRNGPARPVPRLPRSRPDPADVAEPAGRMRMLPEASDLRECSTISQVDLSSPHERRSVDAALTGYVSETCRNVPEV